MCSRMRNHGGASSLGLFVGGAASQGPKSDDMDQVVAISVKGTYVHGRRQFKNQGVRVHVARIPPYSDASLNVTRGPREAHTPIDGEFEWRVADKLNINQ